MPLAELPEFMSLGVEHAASGHSGTATSNASTVRIRDSLMFVSCRTDGPAHCLAYLASERMSRKPPRSAVAMGDKRSGSGLYSIAARAIERSAIARCAAAQSGAVAGRTIEGRIGCWSATRCNSCNDMLPPAATFACHRRAYALRCEFVVCVRVVLPQAMNARQLRAGPGGGFAGRFESGCRTARSTVMQALEYRGNTDSARPRL